MNKKFTRVFGFLLSGVLVSNISLVVAEEKRTSLDEITVTGTREATAKSESSASTVLVQEEEIHRLRPSHPAEVINRVPGVHVNVLTGEGHMTAIRQPITTSPVYLFLEDGIPTRSTGFFNHNALYEVNVPQAAAIEVLKGPGTALYGSDAIGGIINVMTRPAPAEAEFEANLELGGHGWERTLLTGGNSWGDDGFRADLNISHSDGWRDDTEYDRQSTTLRWDRFLDSGASLKTVLAASFIDQAQTGAVSRPDFEDHPTINYTPIGFREVEAIRLSSAYEHETTDSLTSITPYYRHNVLDLMPTWALTYDPTLFTTQNDSFGLTLKHRRDYAPMRTRVIVGADIDYSPGSRDEQSIIPVRVGNIYNTYTINQTVYDYDVTFKGFSPYVHVETSPSERLRLHAGLRYDVLSYDYDNKLSVVTTGLHRRPDDTTVDFNHLSPKLGATYAWTDDINGFISYKHAFRAPSEGQLFRQGRALNTVDLKPVKADSFEVGLRGKVGTEFSYELSVYHMTKRDDIISFQNTIDGTRETLNAGKTLHRGIEVGLGATIMPRLRVNASLSYAKHTYEDWSPKSGIDYNGNEIKQAPRFFANLSIRYRPIVLDGGSVELNWESLGSYWEDDENSNKYEGHDLLNLLVNYPVSRSLEFYGRLNNITDERYATGASFTQFRGEELTPGLPRTLYAGLNYKF
ncbi:TonB-dependent receptor [Sulfuriflexus mobilis]|uniref:TonB-dependent receptor n=1 Tax=Sulfuriflexus mobilis TaxID=1811807 RepID=UPI000F826CD7|nr:TonB-dependent receptor [Sulfuriflexus mobilis]